MTQFIIKDIDLVMTKLDIVEYTGEPRRMWYLPYNSPLFPIIRKYKNDEMVAITRDFYSAIAGLLQI